MHALLSIHDVMPHTLERVTAILAAMNPACQRATVLLVVPGLPWRPGQLARLRQWQDQGLTLAGHGWRHEAAAIRGLYHRLHSRLLSRRAAEHLCLTEAEIAALLQRSWEWFARHDLAPPDLYVPPAWAMGAASKHTLEQAPYRYFETTGGIQDSTNGRFLPLPLAGFEADIPLRRLVLRCWNGVNKAASSPRRPLRLSIHPFDPELLLGENLRHYLHGVATAVDYHAVMRARD